MKITTKVNVEIIAKEEVDEITNEEIEEFKDGLKKDLIKDLRLGDSPVDSYKIEIEVEKED